MCPSCFETLKYLSSFCCRSRAVTLFWESGNFTWRGFLWLFCGMSMSCVDISVKAFRIERQYRSRVEAKTRLSSVSFLIQVFGLKGAQVTKSMNCMLIKVLLSMKRMAFLYFWWQSYDLTYRTIKIKILKRARTSGQVFWQTCPFLF